MKRDQYFPHEVNLRQTSEFMRLIEKEGITGYGVYWGIIEYLRSQDDYIGDLRVVRILAKQMRISTARILRILTDYGLFVLEDDSFQSIKLNVLMEPLERKRRRMDRQSRWNYEMINLRNRRNPLIDNTALVTVKKSKVEESKEEKSRETTSSASSAEEVSADEDVFFQK